MLFLFDFESPKKSSIDSFVSLSLPFSSYSSSSPRPFRPDFLVNVTFEVNVLDPKSSSSSTSTTALLMHFLPDLDCDLPSSSSSSSTTDFVLAALCLLVPARSTKVSSML
eukprot:TRINITY_DN11275_c1_g1_i1.p1 TRINITY_DN11275_c1_g1~~TRINITY_DN11275_c1_g1_i1.p1  ORF type:complete len:110 (-),score=22.88 TRINITY_DN11275_c1_g1_i1:169-498(-)